MNLIDKIKYKTANFVIKSIVGGRSVCYNLTNYSNVRTRYMGINDNGKLLNFYLEVPELSAVINYKAKVKNKPKYKLWKIDKNGKKINQLDSHPILNKLNKPNYLQNKSEFQTMGSQFKDIFGNNFKYITYPAAFNLGMYETWIDNIQLWNLPPWLVDVDFKKNIEPFDVINSTSINEIVDNIYFGNRSLNINDMVIQNDSSIRFENNKALLGDSRLVNIRKPLTNLAYQYDIRNILLNRKGLPLGIIAGDKMDGISGSTFMGSEKEAIQDQLSNQYEMINDGWKAIVTQANLKWIQMSLPIKDMLITEGRDIDKIAVCDQFQFPILLLNELQGSTFSNLDAQKKQLYQDVVIPEFNTDVEDLNTLLKTRENGYLIESDFSHIEVLQQDQKELVDKNKVLNDAVQSLAYDYINDNINYATALNSLIDIWGLSNEMAIRLIPPKIVITDNSISESNNIPQEQLDAQANLRGTVGGVQGILEIQSSVSSGITQYSSALTILIEIYGFNEETARAILGSETNINQNGKQN